MTNPESILVLTDRPDLYGPALNAIGKKGLFFPTANLLTRELLTEPVCCGVILDVKMVMDSDATARDKLFALCSTLPMVRSRLDLEAKKPVFMDPMEALLKSAKTTVHRNQKRVKVRLESSWSLDKDPAMTETNEGVILDISKGGAFLHATNVLPTDDYIHLKIYEMTHKRPIHCAVRWRNTTPMPGRLTGVGLKFLDISSAQLEEIDRTHLKTTQS